MNIDEANQIVSKGFKYQKEHLDIWRVLDTTKKTFSGDCEDYGFTLLWLICDRNIKKFADTIFSGKAKMWSCDTPYGKHAILEYDNVFCDNIERQWKSIDYYANLDYKFRHTYNPYLILYKLAFSSVFK
jgi:hypothetical protein